jgi:hypothetical protein
MIDKRSIATDGYRVRNAGKKLFAIAVAGYISLNIAPPPVPSISKVSQSPYDFTMGGGSSTHTIRIPSQVNADLFGKEETEQLKKLKLKKLQKDDEEILIFIKIFLQCQS